MKPKHFKHEHLDVTTVSGREAVADAFDQLTAWRCAVNTYRARLERETRPLKRTQLELMLYNAETQLRLLEEGED